MPKTKYSDPAPPKVDEHGVPEGATLAVCDNSHVTMTSKASIERKTKCWVHGCDLTLRAVSRQTADRIIDQVRMAHELGCAG